MTRKTIIAALAFLPLPLPLAAQDTDVLVLREAEGIDIADAEGSRVGEVEEVLIDQDGLPAGYLVEVGGFLGIGEREVAIRLNALEWNDNMYVTTLSRAQLEALPEFDR